MTIMTILALWLASHPWRGLWHDSILYAVQALRRLSPANYQNDLYFLYGSQDAFTVFSPLYATFIKLFGLDSAALLLQALGSGLWVGAAIFLLRAMLGGLSFWLGLTMLMIWPASYGPDPEVFQTGEPFLTPRLFVEGLGMLALGCFVRGRYKLGMLPAVAGLVLHPLIAIGPIMGGMLFLFWGKWRALGAASTLFAATAWIATRSGLPVFDRLSLSMDAEWFAVVSQIAPMVSWKAWEAHEWISRTLVALCLVLAAARLSSGLAARLFLCTALLGGGSLLACWIGTGIYDNLLIIQVQPWRALWLTQLCAWIALAWLLGQFWQRERFIQALLLALCLAALTRNTVGGAIALSAAAALCYYVPRPPVHWPRWGNLVALASAGVLLIAWVLEVSHTTKEIAAEISSPEPSWLAVLWVMNAFNFGLGAAAGTVLLLVVWRWCGSHRKGLQLGGFSLAFAVLLYAALYAAYPGKGKYDLSREGKLAVQAAFLPLIPQHAVVYWQNNVLVSWFTLQRSGYASVAQMIGVVFNKGTAIEGKRRMERIQRLGGLDSLIVQNNLQAMKGVKSLPAASAAGLQYVCADTALDFVVLTTQLGGAVAQAQDAPYDKTYYLYDCARMRGGKP
ncbi:hypothetical protein [Pseudoduganella sp. OTU4001]|uniref:hypothetical protein n=1 Tax=Pseudoduganella sp. OTU4001 TaxID=3043854 RepID=UPI00313B6125